MTANRYTQGFFPGCRERSRTGLCWWLHNSVNVPETAELYGVNGWML